ncbi:type I polyketide synthase [Catenulispora pinisilvae]|uniref:type I polyketide synthase n=1 Tax=Catenulispora pinisilvae TaxID=2705253 RepID=UPI0018925D16|nr:type I polyketide synthase [Catenulispora pinisilvae]
MNSYLDGAVAVTGMAVRVPGAGDLAAFWSLLRSGTEGVTHHDKDALLAAGADPALIRRPDYVPSRGMLPTARSFDWRFFGYSRAEAAMIDPQQRIFLECAAAALDDAGIDPARFAGPIGVYGGSDDCDPPTDGDPMLRALGSSRDMLATRVAYKVGLRGPAFTVQSACSTSLTAVHLAIQSLQAYETDAVLAGGVGLAGFGSTGYLYMEGGTNSRDGRSRSFDADASGMVPAEGVGVVVLRRLEDALRDGDHVSAVIRGSALSNDGAEKIGFAAPSVAGQREAILLAQKVADVDPWDIDYVEAHGTATPMGDPVEVQALTDAFRLSREEAGWCRLGAVKSNLGHTGAAAGVVGLIKTALMLEHRELVPSLHFKRPNPLMDLEATPFRVGTRHEPWPERGTPLAAVSAFGIGGTNAHVILEAPPSSPRPVPRPAPRMLALSAGSPEALDRMRGNLAERLDGEPESSLADVSWTLSRRRRFDHRAVVVAEQPAEAAQSLRQAPGPVLPPADRRDRLDRVAFLFPGHGTLDHAAGSAAYRLLPRFAAHFDEMAAIFRRAHALDLSPIVGDGSVAAGWLADFVNQQCGLVTLGYALARQLLDWGITPAGMLGNSIGEYAAAAVAGVWTPADCAEVVYERARTALHTPPGRMVAVRAGAAQVTERIAAFPGVGLAVMGPGNTVVSGPRAAIDACLAAGALDGLDVTVLDLSVAAHSEMMRPAALGLARAVEQAAARRPELRFVSNLTGEWADPDAVGTADYWTAQLCRTVQLDSGIATLIAEGCDTFLELGAGTSMCGSLRRHSAWDSERHAVPMLGRASEDPERSLLRAVGVLWERGADIDVADLARDAQPLVVALPSYPFEPSDPDSGRTAAAAPRQDGAPRPDSPDSPSDLEQLWCASLGVASVNETDDFFAIGGESLMAVHLISKVSQATGAAITAADFLRQPTFGRLAELVGAASGAERAAGSVGLVALREGASDRPVFLIADGMGSASSYLELADLVDVDRPVLGLEPSGGRYTTARVERMAEQYLDAVRGAQKQGPYTLAGWSYGAVIAHEMARLLLQEGEVVDVLLCFDGFVRGRGGRPLAAVPAALLEVVRLEFAVRFGSGQVGALARRAPELRRNLSRCARALLRYRPRPVDCPVVVFRSGAPDSASREALRRDLSGFYRTVEVLSAAGDHWSMLTRPHVVGLAGELSARLAKATPSR